MPRGVLVLIKGVLAWARGLLGRAKGVMDWPRLVYRNKGLWRIVDVLLVHQAPGLRLLLTVVLPKIYIMYSSCITHQTTHIIHSIQKYVFFSQLKSVNDNGYFTFLVSFLN